MSSKVSSGLISSTVGPSAAAAAAPGGCAGDSQSALLASPDLHMKPYGCVSTGLNTGMIEVVMDSATLAGIQVRYLFCLLQSLLLLLCWC